MNTASDRHRTRRLIRHLLGLALVVSVLVWVFGDREAAPEVVVYTTLDNVFSREILDDFAQQTGIRVRAVFDTEATKTTGLIERIRREAKRPRCDVLWNNELLRTIRLADEGLLAPYESPSRVTIPEEYRDPEARWTGFAARARAVAYDLGQVPNGVVPRTHDELHDPRWRGRVAIADPRFGTTGSHMAILHVAWGEARLRAWLEALVANDVQVVSGNASSRDRVLSGDVALGLTDTDDVEVARRQGASIRAALLEGDGTIVIPNSVAMIAGCPHPEEAKRLIDFLLSAEIERRLAASSSRQIPVRSDVEVPPSGLRMTELRLFPCDFVAAARALPEAVRLAAEILGR